MYIQKECKMQSGTGIQIKIAAADNKACEQALVEFGRTYSQTCKAVASHAHATCSMAIPSSIILMSAFHFGLPRSAALLSIIISWFSVAQASGRTCEWTKRACGDWWKCGGIQYCDSWCYGYQRYTGQWEWIGHSGYKRCMCCGTKPQPPVTNIHNTIVNINCPGTNNVCTSAVVNCNMYMNHQCSIDSKMVSSYANADCNQALLEFGKSHQQTCNKGVTDHAHATNRMNILSLILSAFTFLSGFIES